MTTARYIGILDGTNEDSLPDDMRRPICLFKLLRPLGSHSIGATVTDEDLAVLGFSVPVMPYEGDTV